ncbi:GAF domain-containing sensor histidine kinase [Calidifontibacter terrae]
MNPELQSLTGIRSSKGSYYREYVRSDERLHGTLRAMDAISQAVVRTVEGPRELLQEVVQAARSHLDADWALLLIAAGEFPGARPRCLVAARDGSIVVDEDDLPPQVAREVDAVRAGAVPGDRAQCVRAPMMLEGRVVGLLSARHRLPEEPVDADIAVLRILASQAVVSLHTSEQFQTGLLLHRRAQRLNAETEAQRRDLNERDDALRRAENRLQVAAQRELVEEERQRIARELHDTVTQQVLSVGMALELARGDAATLVGGRPLERQLAATRDVAGHAVEQLRQAIFALRQPHSDRVQSLSELLQSLVAQHGGPLAVRFRVEGVEVEVPEQARHDLVRTVGEALFNVTVHAGATRAHVRLRYLPGELLLFVADDGDGDPAQLRRHLRLVARTPGDGRHRGLANMAERVDRLGGAMTVRRARSGGVRLEFRIPLPVRESAPPPGVLSDIEQKELS